MLLFAAFNTHFCSVWVWDMAGFTVYHVKASRTSFGSSYGPGEDMSKATTKAEHTSFIVLFFLSSDTLPALWFGPYMFLVIHFFQFGNKQRSINCAMHCSHKQNMTASLKPQFKVIRLSEVAKWLNSNAKNEQMLSNHV